MNFRYFSGNTRPNVVTSISATTYMLIFCVPDRNRIYLIASYLLPKTVDEAEHKKKIGV